MDSPFHIHSLLQQVLLSQEATLHSMKTSLHQLSSLNRELSYYHYPNPPQTFPTNTTPLTFIHQKHFFTTTSIKTNTNTSFYPTTSTVISQLPKPPTTPFSHSYSSTSLKLLPKPLDVAFVPSPPSQPIQPPEQSLSTTAVNPKPPKPLAVTLSTSPPSPPQQLSELRPTQEPLPVSSPKPTANISISQSSPPQKSSDSEVSTNPDLLTPLPHLLQPPLKPQPKPPDSGGSTTTPSEPKTPVDREQKTTRILPPPKPPDRDVSTMLSPNWDKTLSHCDSELLSIATAMHGEACTEKSQPDSAATDSLSQVTKEHKVFPSTISIGLETSSLISIHFDSVCSGFVYDRDPHLAYFHGSNFVVAQTPNILSNTAPLQDLQHARIEKLEPCNLSVMCTGNILLGASLAEHTPLAFPYFQRDNYDNSEVVFDQGHLLVTSFSLKAISFEIPIIIVYFPIVRTNTCSGVHLHMITCSGVHVITTNCARLLEHVRNLAFKFLPLGLIFLNGAGNLAFAHVNLIPRLEFLLITKPNMLHLHTVTQWLKFLLSDMLNIYVNKVTLCPSWAYASPNDNFHLFIVVHVADLKIHNTFINHHKSALNNGVNGYVYESQRMKHGMVKGDGINCQAQLGILEKVHLVGFLIKQQASSPCCFLYICDTNHSPCLQRVDRVVSRDESPYKLYYEHQNDTLQGIPQIRVISSIDNQNAACLRYYCCVDACHTPLIVYAYTIRVLRVTNGEANCALLPRGASFLLRFGSRQQWHPGENFITTMASSSLQFKLWDPGDQLLVFTMAWSCQFKQWDPGKYLMISIFLQP